MESKPQTRIESVVCLLLILGLMVAGCAGGSSPQVEEPAGPAASASASESPPESVSAPLENDNQPPLAEVPDAGGTSPVMTSSEVLPEQPPQVLLTWARDAGGLNHCDRLSIYVDGRVEATVCKTAQADPVIVSAVSDEQLAKLSAWVAEYGPFDRREMEISRAVRTTHLNGTGSSVASLETKIEIAAFAATVFFSTTGTR